MNELIELAREAISFHFENKKLKNILIANLKNKRGVFVTLTIDGNLRGCIGFVEPIYPLGQAIVEAARSAAFHDPRFPPLTKEEFVNVNIEISILTKPALIKGNYLESIKIGRDGLIIEKNQHKGLLLPQVFTEFNADSKMALEMTCEKAGLNRDAWRDKTIKVYKFQVEIIKE